MGEFNFFGVLHATFLEIEPLLGQLCARSCLLLSNIMEEMLHFELIIIE